MLIFPQETKATDFQLKFYLSLGEKILWSPHPKVYKNKKEKAKFMNEDELIHKNIIFSSFIFFR